jgi:hypothetical protein
MGYHDDLISRALDTKYSFLEIQHEDPVILQLRIDNMNIRQIKSQVKKLKNIKKIGLVSSSKDKDTDKPYKLITTYSDTEEVKCSLIDDSNIVTKVGYISNSVFESVLLQEKENNTIH